MRVKMVVAYDGTNYSGWQIQPNGVTIEQKLNEALQALLGEDIRVTGASRTDAGVHSLGNVCIFDTDTRMPAEKISYALNQRLPEDIVVQDSCEVPDTFHPRFSRSRKTYVPDTKPAVPHADQAAGYIFLSLSAGCGENAGGRGLSGWRA